MSQGEAPTPSRFVFPLYQQIVPLDFGQKLKTWCKEGFKELGDSGGMGIGRTTYGVLHHPQFRVDPHQVNTAVLNVGEKFF